MVDKTMHGIQIELDENGFIIDPDLWNEDVARAMAKSAGIDQLTEEHWKVLYFIRDYYKQYHIAPMINILCRETGFSPAYIHTLFPTGPALGACRLAGLPKSTGCV